MEFPDSGVDEFVLADDLLEAVRGEGLDDTMVVRPHPAEPQEAWRRWLWRRRERGVRLDDLPLEAALEETRLAVGICSLLLCEMCLLGIPAAALQPSDADPAYFCQPLEQLGVVRVRSGNELRRWLTSPGVPSVADAVEGHRSAIDRAGQVLLETALNSSRRDMLVSRSGVRTC
jgi:hypothetical protein